LVTGVAIAVFEVFTAKMRLFRLPELLAGGFVLALLGAVTAWWPLNNATTRAC